MIVHLWLSVGRTGLDTLFGEGANPVIFFMKQGIHDHDTSGMVVG